MIVYNSFHNYTTITTKHVVTTTGLVVVEWCSLSLKCVVSKTTNGVVLQLPKNQHKDERIITDEMDCFLFL